MSFGKRIWRITRGLAGRLGEGRQAPAPTDAEIAQMEERLQDAAAEMEARREVGGLQSRLPAPGPDLPGGTIRGLDAQPGDLPGDLLSQPQGRQTADSILPPPLGTSPDLPRDRPAVGPVPASDPLAAHYAVLGLPPGANIREAERAYQQLKQECRAEDAEDDRQAADRAARLDEAYQALRKALVPEKRL